MTRTPRLAPIVVAGLLVSAALTIGWTGAPDQPATEKKQQPKEADPAYALDFKVNRLDGKETDLNTYKGKVVVIVNVASKCGYTGQYAALEELYREHKDDGLVILGFPANNFREQEPGSNEEIAEFCSSNYGVTFPLFEKISVKGDDQHPLYKKLTSQPEPIGGDPKWNFTKFVVNKEGRVVARFDAKGDGKSRAALEPDLVKKVEELLGLNKPNAEKKPEKKPPTAGS